jgi:hypothetical protein
LPSSSPVLISMELLLNVACLKIVMRVLVAV